MSDQLFRQDCDHSLDKSLNKYENIVILGDLNFDVLSPDTCARPLLDVCDTYAFNNLITKPTCFTTFGKPSLLDVILTNKSDLVHKTLNFNCGLSDFHNMVCVQLKSEVQQTKTNYTTYRSFRSLDTDNFNSDLETKLSQLEYNTSNDLNHIYDNFSQSFIEVVDKHAPLKKRKMQPKPVPFMNRNLREAIYKKRMLFNKYNKFRTPKNWEKYRQQRILVTHIRRKSIDKYFLDRCVGGCRSGTFWNTIKPFLTNKGSIHQKDTILCENDVLINDQAQICDIFNDFFVNVAKNIGSDSISVDENHPSICSIEKSKLSDAQLTFRPVDENFISKQISNLNTKKATGHDGISAKLVKLAKPVILPHLTSLINISLTTSVFPDSLKLAQVIPLHKKNSTLDKSNYRPVSILPTISKIFEQSINQQLSDFFNTQHFNPFLSAFRSGYGCQTVLLKILEDWKKALDENKFVAAILMDLSKAFDCLPHDLLLLKLKSYGLSESACKLLNSYLSNRKQCVKITPNTSAFTHIIKGVPQGSILGPVLFNIFINDIFNEVKSSQMYNYADDNTLSCSDHNLEVVKGSLEDDSRILIQWFHDNKMKANPEKFQAIAIGKKSNKENITFNIDGLQIKCEDDVNLLGLTIDFNLNFNKHISNLCKKASRQLNVLKRIGKNLCKLGKLNIYYSFIMSNFNYCPLAWGFCGEGNIKKIEKLQERSLRFIYNDYTSSYCHLLSLSKLPTLRIRRIRNLALETFKILYKNSPSYLHDLVNFKKCSYSFRYTNTLTVPRVRTTRYGLGSFRYRAPALWNSLPQHIRNETNFSAFRSVVGSWDGESCSCSSCRV